MDTNIESPYITVNLDRQAAFEVAYLAGLDANRSLSAAALSAKRDALQARHDRATAAGNANSGLRGSLAATLRSCRERGI